MKIAALPRKRINDLLQSVFDYPLTLVEAPMGFGKTTAVRDFIDASACPAIWIPCLNATASTTLFWKQFADGLAQYHPETGAKLAHLGFPTDAPGIARFFDIFEEIDFRERTVLVVDDIHLLSDTCVANLLLQLAEEQTDRLHMILITRDTTHIQFTRLLSMGLCAVLSQHRLKFTVEEIREYCRLAYGDISSEDLERLSTYTDGWISLVYMILLGMTNNIPIGMSQTLDMLIESALYQVYDERIQNFLLKLSIMDEFKAKQARYVTQEQDTEALLKKLLKENAFVRYDEIRKTYRIHNVLLDFLRSKQRFSVEERNGLLSRLGMWHLERGEFRMGYACLCEAGEPIQVLEHLNDPANIRNEMSEFPGSIAMFDALSEDLLMKYPLAYLQHIIISILRGNEAVIADCEGRLHRLIDAYANMDGITEDHRSRIIAEALILFRFTQFNHLDPSSETNDRILRLLAGRQSYIMQRDNEVTFGSPSVLYIYFRDNGSFKSITELLGERYTVYARFANGCGSGGDHLVQAEYALETGDFRAAELAAQKAVLKARMYQQTSIEICAAFVLMRSYILASRVDEAQGLLNALEKSVFEINNSVLDTSVEICKGYVYACLNQAERIPYWLQTGGMAEADMFIQGLAFGHIVYGKAVMLTGKYLELEMLTEAFHQQFNIFCNRLGHIHNGIFSAVAKFHLYGQDSGAEALNAALSMARADNLVMPFIENGPFILDMLRPIVKNSPGDRYLASILEGCEAYRTVLSKSAPKKVVLSQREKEVLTLASEGLNRESIAGRLTVSQGTVKTHLQNIYHKLDVNGKVSAIKLAKMHGLI